MRRLSPVRGFVCRCAPRHTPSLKRARSRVGYVSMPARIHISAGRTGVEKHAGDSSLECVYIEMHRESLRDVFDTNLWVFTTVGKFSVLPCISNVRRILICRIYCNKYPFEANVSVRRRIIVLLDISGQTYEIFLEKLVN